MAEIRFTKGEGEKLTRLTLFPPSGKRVTQPITEYYYDERERGVRPGRRRSNAC
jgi:hypothetical protein